MADEAHSPGEGQGRDDTKSPWITRLLLGALGISAVLRYLAGGPRARQASLEEIPREEEVRHLDGRIEHPLVRFEPSDASFRAILLILIAVMGLAAFHFSMVMWFFHRYRSYEASIKQSPFPLQQGPSDGLPAEPRLEQVNRMAEIEKGNVYLMEETKEHILHSYGSTPEANFVHIPIKRAMDLLANKLPARAEPAGDAKKENGLVDSGESNSGRMFRGEPRWFER